MRLTYIPSITALLAAVALHLSYLVAADAGHVPWCIPYIDSCTSISATGRQGLERFIFRALIMPTAILMMLYWTLSYQWLKALGSPWRRANRAMLGLGVAAGCGLLLFTTVLGVAGDDYRLMRRLGTAVFFGLSVSAQIILTLQIAALSRARAAAVSRAVRRILAGLCLAVLAVGAASLVWPLVSDGYRDVQNAVAWTATLLIILHIFVTGRAWRDSGFSATFVVASPQR
jgi:hypothetical protein